MVERRRNLLSWILLGRGAVLIFVLTFVSLADLPLLGASFIHFAAVSVLSALAFSVGSVPLGTLRNDGSFTTGSSQSTTPNNFDSNSSQ